jgi:hypothetical protein
VKQEVQNQNKTMSLTKTESLLLQILEVQKEMLKAISQTPVKPIVKPTYVVTSSDQTLNGETLLSAALGYTIGATGVTVILNDVGGWMVSDITGTRWIMAATAVNDPSGTYIPVVPETGTFSIARVMA